MKTMNKCKLKICATETAVSYQSITLSLCSLYLKEPNILKHEKGEFTIRSSFHFKSSDGEYMSDTNYPDFN